MNMIWQSYTSEKQCQRVIRKFEEDVDKILGASTSTTSTSSTATYLVPRTIEN